MFPRILLYYSRSPEDYQEDFGEVGTFVAARQPKSHHVKVSTPPSGHAKAIYRRPFLHFDAGR